MGLSFNMSYEEYDKWVEAFKAKRAKATEEQIRRATEQGDAEQVRRLRIKLDTIQNDTF